MAFFGVDESGQVMLKILPMKNLLVSLIGLTVVSPLVAQSSPRHFTLPHALREASGLYIESPDKMWWHNDSGGEPVLYATDGQGNLVDSVRIRGASNRDWEDITVDMDGTLYIGDFGNNRNNRQDLTIYIWQPETAKLDSISFSYPEQRAFPPERKDWNFNMEGFFWANDTLHLFTKNQIRYGTDVTRHYVLTDEPGTQQAILIDSLYLKDRVVTAAALSPQGDRVALVAYTYGRILGIFPKSRASLFIFSDFPGLHYLQGHMDTYRLWSWPASQYEAVDFLNNDTVLVGSEAVVFRKARARRVPLMH